MTSTRRRGTVGARGVEVEMSTTLIGPARPSGAHRLAGRWLAAGAIGAAVTAAVLVASATWSRPLTREEVSAARPTVLGFGAEDVAFQNAVEMSLLPLSRP